MKPTPAPRHLRPETAAWWDDTLEAYDLAPHHVRLLTLAAEAFDRGTEAREAIEADGAYVRDRYGTPRAHPAVAVERDSRIAFARLVRELNLDDDPAPARPPGIAGRYAS